MFVLEGNHQYTMNAELPIGSLYQPGVQVNLTFLTGLTSILSLFFINHLWFPPHPLATHTAHIFVTETFQREAIYAP